jgi:hypothetical protein
MKTSPTRRDVVQHLVHLEAMLKLINGDSPEQGQEIRERLKATMRYLALFCPDR